MNLDAKALGLDPAICLERLDRRLGKVFRFGLEAVILRSAARRDCLNDRCADKPAFRGLLECALNIKVSSRGICRRGIGKHE